MKFRIRADATFEADNIGEAMGLLAAHFINPDRGAELTSGHIKVESESPQLLDHAPPSDSFFFYDPEEWNLNG